MASQITGVSIVCSAVCSGADQRKHQSSASLAFVKGIHRRPVDSPHKGPVTRKVFLFDDVIMMLPVRSGFVWYNYVIFYICTEQIPNWWLSLICWSTVISGSRYRHSDIISQNKKHMDWSHEMMEITSDYILLLYVRRDYFTDHSNSNAWKCQNWFVWIST